MNCPYCKISVKSINAWNNHIALEISKMSIDCDSNCPNCGFTFSNIRALRVHIKTRVCYAQTGPHKCNRCDKIFVENNSLRRHLDRNVCKRTISKKESQLIKCKYCSYETYSKGAMTIHNKNNSCLPKDDPDRWIVEFLFDIPETQLFDDVTSEMLDAEYIKEISNETNKMNLKISEAVKSLIVEKINHQRVQQSIINEIEKLQNKDQEFVEYISNYFSFEEIILEDATVAQIQEYVSL